MPLHILYNNKVRPVAKNCSNSENFDEYTDCNYIQIASPQANSLSTVISAIASKK